MNLTPNSQHIAGIRRAYEKALTHRNPSHTQLEWRLSRFDRGVKLASEIQALGKSAYGIRVADLGAAHGGDSSAFVAHGAWTVAVDYLDYDYSLLRQQLKGVASRPAQFSALQADVNGRLPLKDHVFDVVLALGVIEHVRDLQTFFREGYRVLRTDGFLIVVEETSLKGTASAWNDPFFNVPFIAVLPMRLRRFIAERVLGKHYPFNLANRTFYWAGTIVRPAKRAGFHVMARKYADSPIAARLSTWPMARMWRVLLERVAFDFLVLQKLSRKKP